MIVNHKASALKFIANRINTNLEKYTGRPGAQSIRAKANNLANVFDTLSVSASLKSPLETPEAHFIRVSNQANLLLSKWQKESDGLFELYRSYWLQIQSEILSSTGLNKPSPFGDEIRSSLKSMGSEQRTNKMLSLVKNNESPILGSIYEAPAFLSGLAEGEMDAHFNIYFGQHAPELLKERKNLDETYSSSVVAFMKAYQSGLKSFMDSKKMCEIEREKELADTAQAELVGALRASI